LTKFDTAVPLLCKLEGKRKMSSHIGNWHNKIVIHLIRKGSNPDGSNDDYIILKWKGEDTYQLWYHDGNCRVVDKHHVTVLSGEELDTYLQSLFTLLRHDREAFSCVQFDIPCCPSIMFYPQDLKKKIVRKTLNRILPLLCVAGNCDIPVGEI
jgi:hypothetical protein